MNQKALHTKSIWKSNLLSDLRIAKEAGFGAVEMAGDKVHDYLAAGMSTQKVKEALEKWDIQMISINDVAHVERTDDDAVHRMLAETESLSRFAHEVGCDCIQLVPLCALEGRPWEEIRTLTAQNIRRIADVGARYGVRFQLEPVAWSPIHSLSQSLELIEAVERDNFGMVIDFWHLWYGGKTTPDEVAKMNPGLIYHIHFGDGKKNPPGTTCDETDLRGHYAGNGDIDVPQWVQAVKASGYDEWWTYELVSAHHWQMDTQEVAETTSRLLDEYVFKG
ncbi:sugar phosphate isomerase/epimerase family protein [Anoxynatronum sibiricum]|uniref:Sugar phosphate isomerase/epimerase family protein n=1 Tax=Anoxynatronum sibiricum TaxID=210623 RepID=A0ABU9VVA1_9CLOT